jgi:hypothetical protein
MNCERCGIMIECKAQLSEVCDCTKIKLDLNEAQYVSELHTGCLCNTCLEELKLAYNKNL